MHLLYLDDSGSAANPAEDYLVLGGVAVFEAQVYHVTQQLDALAEDIYPADPNSVEFHASEIFARRTDPWRGMTRDQARGVIISVLKILREAYNSAKAFACAVHKASYPDQDPMELAFEDLCSRFDRYLQRLRSQGDRQRGLLILDRSADETSLRKLSKEFRQLGTRWGGLHAITETPLFVDSRASRLVQLADHVAYSVFRRFNASDATYFDVIASRFDESGGVIHGLSHKAADNHHCRCPACVSRLSASGGSQ